MSSAVYRGYHGRAGGGLVTVERRGITRELRQYVRHSPCGFSWGYDGSGPSELARCILIDHFGLHDAAEHDPHLDPPVDYLRFRAECVAQWTWPSEPGSEPTWLFSGRMIEEWIALHARSDAA